MQTRAYTGPSCEGCGRSMQTRATSPYCWSNPECRVLNQKHHNLMKNYGISLKDYQRMHDAQHGLCYICGLPPAGQGRNDNCLHVHHSHETGKVLGLLCRSCNVYWESRWHLLPQISYAVKEMF